MINSAQIGQQKNRAVSTGQMACRSIKEKFSSTTWSGGHHYVHILWNLVAVLCLLKTKSFVQGWILQWADMTKIQAWDGRVSDENIELAIACLQQYDKIVKLWEILYFILLLSY